MAGTLVQANITDAIASFSPRAPLWNDTRVLVADTNETHTIPTGANWVFFSTDGDFYAKPGGTAAIPAADVTDGTASSLNPVAWFLDNETSIGLISATTGRVVVMSFYT